MKSTKNKFRPGIDTRSSFNSGRSNESNIRQLLANKVNIPRLQKGRPKNSEGKDGEFALRDTRNGFALYIKASGKWYEISLSSVTSTPNSPDIDLDGTIERGMPVIRARYKNTGLYNKDAAFQTPKILVKDRNNDSTLLVQKDGVLTARNESDSADADIRCASIKDSNGNKVVQVTAVSSSVNFVKAYGSIEENAFGPTLVAEGTDTNIPLTISPKGSGTLYLTATGAGGVAINVPIVGIRFTFDTVNVTQKFHGTATHLGLIKCETDGEFQIFNVDADSDTSAAHIKIASSDDLYLAAGGGEIKLSSGGASSSAMDLGTEFGVLTGGGGSYLTHTATATSTGLKIDSNFSGDDASTGIGMLLDFDRTVPSSGTASHDDIGLKVEIASASLGSSTTRGIQVQSSAATSGTSTNIGIDVDADGADSNIGLLINTAGTHIHMQSNADAPNDYGTIAVADTGDMTITTIGNGTTDSDLILDVDGDINMDAAGGDVNITSADIKIDAAKKLYFDGGGDTYMYEVVSDSLGIKVGGDFLLTLAEYGANGNEALFKTSCATFTRNEATEGESAVLGGLGTQTDIDFRHTNKFRLEMTGDIGTMNLIFPKGSGNFLLVCTTDGDHDVSNWKVYENDESAATTTDVMWAGGSVPAFTDNGVDIVSFYWDALEQQAYGTASLAFATP